MSAVSRVLVRSRLAAVRRAPIQLRSLSSVARPAAVRPAAVSAARLQQISQVRFASSAAAEVEAEEAAPEWPVREAPPLSEKDVKRLTRQRNIGM